MKKKQTAPRFPVTVSEGGVSAKVRKSTQVKNGKRYVLYIADFILLGKRKQIGRARFEDAKAEALKACREIASGNQLTLTLTNQERCTYIRACEALRERKVQLDVAAREFAIADAILDGRVSIIEACRDWARRNSTILPRISIANAVCDLKKECASDGKSLARQKQISAPLDRLATAFNIEVGAVTPGLVASYLAGLSLTERTKRNHRDVIGYFNRWLVLRGFLSKGTDWLENVQKYSARKIGEIEIYTPEEIAKLIEKADETMLPFIVIQAFAGLRHAEAARLDWSEIELSDRAGESFIEVKVAKSKTGERRLVPVQDNLKQWLFPLQKQRGAVCGYANTTKQLLKIAAAASVEWKHNGLRHSFISYRVAATADVPRVADEAGNSVQMIRQHYLRRVKPAEATRWFSIEPKQSNQTLMKKAA